MTYNDVVNEKAVVLVEFYASWCPHCHQMMPVVDQVKELLEGKVAVYQFDIDENRELAEQEGVQSIPTFVVYKNGKEVWRHTGELEGEALLSHLEGALH